jgi:hypothetical protein
VPALNAGGAHAHCLADLIAQRCQGWMQALRAHLPGTAHGAPA